VPRLRQGGGGDSTQLHLLRQDIWRTDGSEDAVGIAAALRVVRDGVSVDSVIPGGPAFLSGGIQPDHLITAIDGAKVTGHFHANEITDMIRGQEGSRLTIECLSAEFTGPPLDRSKLEFVDLVSSMRVSNANNIHVPHRLNILVRSTGSHAGGRRAIVEGVQGVSSKGGGQRMHWYEQHARCLAIGIPLSAGWEAHTHIRLFNTAGMLFR